MSIFDRTLIWHEYRYIRHHRPLPPLSCIDLMHIATDFNVVSANSVEYSLRYE